MFAVGHMRPTGREFHSPALEPVQSEDGMKEYVIIEALNGIVIAKLVLELLAVVHMLHLYFSTLDTGAIITLSQKHSLGYADTLQDAATGWSMDDSDSECEMEI
ncbi:hypothetical protein TNCV_2493081 [Trichonephila clavipes]|uniref:Uncharacterized protein n=1 Tax=Trichonephila clavipes TaxID=2585209 RepID=A0A8X6RU60_TRICX|nr:hypothetical protein TNCV_2493081 [Trichonephila clavipes]